MSLDVYLKSDKKISNNTTGIFVRENGRTRELSYDEVNIYYPDYNELNNEYETDILFEANITHNLNTMAEQAGIYMELWRPEEIGITKANQLIEPLTQGLFKLKSYPEKYKKFNPSNGWGNYDNLVTFVTKYLDACNKYPDAQVEVSR